MFKVSAVNLCLIFFIVFLLFFSGIFVLTGKFFNSNDYYFHFYRSQNKCFLEHYSLNECKNYAPGYALISSLFSFNEGTFLLFNLFLICFLIPFIIYHYNKSILGLLIYFCSGFIFNVFYAGIFAQLLLSIFFLISISIKEFNLFDLLFLILSPFIHSTAPFFVLLMVVFKFFENFKFERLNSFVFLLPSKLSFSVLFKLMPFPLWLYLNNLSFGKIFLILVFLFMALTDARSVLFIPLCLALWLPSQLIKKPLKIKQLIVLNLIFFFILSLILWGNDLITLNLNRS